MDFAHASPAADHLAVPRAGASPAAVGTVFTGEGVFEAGVSDGAAEADLLGFGVVLLPVAGFGEEELHRFTVAGGILPPGVRVVGHGQNLPMRLA